MKIAHISDVHIRFSSRHEEYKEVFERLINDLKKQKPERISITGDLNHLKVNMSPGSIELLSELLSSLSEIAPVDVILGNHDMNLQQKEQGDTISPIIKIVNKFFHQKNPVDTERNIAIIDSENSKKIDFSKKGVYLFVDSGFYKISKNLTYGVYSCKDNKILTLEKKEPNVKYVALYHGQIKGARGDNGYELFGDNLLSTHAFSNFDIVMLGDIHEHQTFREDESMAYAGSLIQQDYSESIDKGYLMWDLETNSFQRRYILNDYGFAKINIAKGELIEERIENIKFSNDKKKTKVYILWEDYEENYSTEKESQIAKLVKQKYGCDIVKVEFSEVRKSEQDNSDVADSLNQETFIEQIKNYLKETNPEEDDETIKDVLELAETIDKELEIPTHIDPVRVWDIDRIEISNIFSFPEAPTVIQLDQLRGATGIFGRNYSGKSNITKALVWGLYQQILGGGDAKKIINLYTQSNKGYVKINLSINGEKYFIKRDVITTFKKNGESSNTYPIEYKKLVMDDDGREKWVDQISDKKANERKEVKNIILESIGDVEDFTKVCLQTQNGKEGYLNQSQQPKNDLVNRYLGLESFRDRYEYANTKLNEIKKRQKELGSIPDLQQKIIEIENKLNLFKEEYSQAEKEKNLMESKKDKIDSDIISESKKLKQYQNFLAEETSDESVVLNNIESIKFQLQQDEKSVSELSQWLSVNFKKELPFDEKDDIDSLKFQLAREDESFKKEKEQYVSIDNWIKQNPAKEIISIDGFDQKIQELNIEIANLNSKLPTYKGEKCPTCGHITAQPNPEMYNQCLSEISEKKQILNGYLSAVNQHKIDLAHNNDLGIKASNLQTLKAILVSRKNTKDMLSQKISLISQSYDIISHNKDVEQKSVLLQSIKNSVDNKLKTIDKLKNNLEKIKFNNECKNHNIELESKIQELQEESKSYRFSIYGLSQQITGKNGDIRVEENNLKNYTDKLDEVKREERVFKKYSLYLQAVHRDGIPARIIRRKLPIINNKINSILSTMVNFKIEMNVTPKGDVVEGFYFSPDKSDMLPLSFASGAQGFISSVVIKDALHYMSNLIKPSLNIIDEGFGTLDDELITAIITVLQYLRNKYKNVLVVTHRNEIKDSVNNIIDVYKTSDGISQEILSINKDAGITKLNIS